MMQRHRPIMFVAVAAGARSVSGPRGSCRAKYAAMQGRGAVAGYAQSNAIKPGDSEAAVRWRRPVQLRRIRSLRQRSGAERCARAVR
jgi:hypothetical protein